jgi:hypothetical protein
MDIAVISALQKQRGGYFLGEWLKLSPFESDTLCGSRTQREAPNVLDFAPAI